MLKKLMKYDLRAIGRFWWLIATFTLLVCAFEGLLLRTSITVLQSGIGALWAGICMILFYLGMLSVSMTLPLTLLLVFYRFYRQLYTDIGYFTFTLPASRKQILTAKTFSAVFWTLLQLLVIGLGTALILFLAPPATEGAYFNLVVYARLADLAQEIWNGIGMWAVVYAVELVMLMLIGIWITVGFMQMCITVGATVFKKHKLVASVVIYTVASAFVILVVDTFTSVSAVLLADGFIDVLSVSSGALQCAALAIILLIACVISTSVAVFMHLVTLDRIERKLSLA